MGKFDENDIQELKDMVRIGVVSSVNTAKMTAKVKIEELGIITADLKIVQQSSWIPHVGQWVLCIFKPDGEGDGFILGGV